LAGRDGSGQDGTTRAITDRLSSRALCVVALPTPSNRANTPIDIRSCSSHNRAAGERPVGQDRPAQVSGERDGDFPERSSKVNMLTEPSVSPHQPRLRARRSKSGAWLPVWNVLLGLCLLLAATACLSTGGGASGASASVIIENRSMAEIAAAATEVFAADGYQGGGLSGGKMVFEKGASRLTTMSRDGLYATQQGAQTINRVRVEIIPLSTGTHRLQCQAYMVSGGSDPFFQDEVRLTNLRSGPYWSLLNKIKKQLK